MNIRDDPNLHKGIKKNYLSFAGGGSNTRSTQLFIAFEDLDFLGNEPWETPFGMVVEGQRTLDSLYKGYGDIPPIGKGPDQQKIHNRGNQYLRSDFPLVDFILSCYVEENVLPDAEKNVDETSSNGVDSSQESPAGTSQDLLLPDAESSKISAVLSSVEAFDGVKDVERNKLRGGSGSNMVTGSVIFLRFLISSPFTFVVVGCLVIVLCCIRHRRRSLGAGKQS